MMQTVFDPTAPLPSRGDVLALTLGDLAERVSRLETTLLSERDDYKRRLELCARRAEVT